MSEPATLTNPPHVAGKLGTDAEAAKARADDRRKAEAMWLNARPLERGDPVDRYLLSRAIDLAELGLPGGAPFPCGG